MPSFHRTGSKDKEVLVKKLYQQWLVYVKTEKLLSNYVCVNNMFELERRFETDINVYSMFSDKSVAVIYKTRGTSVAKSQKKKTKDDEFECL